MEKGEIEGRGVEVGCTFFLKNFFFGGIKGMDVIQAAKYTGAGGYFSAFYGLMDCGMLVGFFACICEA
ncbi:hypothetical protein [Pseudobacter ginsenosidimutans]|uniref:Uncharacterized protein n=1 Tax=Pseudobacter ginsenosidimutans TaxID=661488 RepID=A0A4Q7MSH3_9BACT|nr:hypothetical protein [Pseudobacter ginsenosidimutans]QEC41452.1 hypothetical protein FSB84_06995 [Pseudobacter ginsenosidimutans]RZS71766.1 hypothetical protein EV199_3677 [Pseudobacter ginsenosidimutans]